jgi:hypothetical protein
MAEFEVQRDNVRVAGFHGFGAQFNQNVFAPVTAKEGVTKAHLDQLPGHLEALAPHFVRIFFNRNAFSSKPLRDSFRSTVDLAQQVASSINITWAGGGIENPDKSMGRFAQVLADLREGPKPATKVEWVTVQNEPNGEHTKIEMNDYARMYKKLDKHLRALDVRKHFKFMGGDLVGTTSGLHKTQEQWFKFIASPPMAKLLAAHSVHIYWDHGDTPKIANRLNEIQKIVQRLPKAGRRDVYVTEYGVRGFFKQPHHKPVHREPGVLESGKRVVDSNINAFQHAWFNLLAAQMGFHGLVKWDAYFGKYDLPHQDFPQEYGMLGQPGPDGWKLRPSYWLMRLFTRTVKPGWDVIDVRGPRGDPRLVVGFQKPGGAGALTIIGLDRNGGHSDTFQSTPVHYRLGNLPHNTVFRLLYWNRQGGGKTVLARPLRSSNTGTLDVVAPLGSVFAITTLPRREVV